MSTEAPPQIVALDALFHRALASMDQARASKRTLDQALRSLTGYQYDDLRWDPDARDLVEREVRNFAGIVARIAGERFSLRGARADIDVDAHLAPYRDAERAIRDRCRNDYEITVDQMMGEIETQWRGFRPITLWHQIAAAHAPETVAAQAARRAARCLADIFELARRPQPRTVRGRIELEIAVRTDRQGGDVSLRYESQRLHALAVAFETFAVAEFPEDTSGIAGIGHALARVSAASPRQRIALPADAEAVVFLTAIKLYLPDQAAAALNRFVTIHAPEIFSRR